MSLKNFVSLLEEVNDDPRVRFIPFDIKEIEVDERVRLKCMIPPCPNYDKNKFCPPNLPDIEFIRKALAKYEGGVLMVMTVPYSDENVAEVRRYVPQNELMRLIGKFEKLAWQNVNHLAFGLTVGGCKLCDECPPAGQPCNRPLEAHPGITGFGIDITTLARKLGVNVEWPVKTELNFMGLLFA